jgi:ABC-2 type transport system permease protein
VTAAIVACGALLQRDLRGVLRSRSQLYSSILFPLILMAVLGTGVSEGLDPSHVRDGDYVTFLVPGVMAMTLLFSSTFSSASYYRDRDSGLLRVMLASPQPPAVILTGKGLAGVTVGSLQALVVLGVAAVIPGIELQWQYGAAGSVGLALAALLLLALLLNGFAQLLATRIRTMQGFHLVMNLLLFPLLLFSGAFFPIEELPVWLKALAYVNPLTYAVDLLQLALYAESSDGFIGVPVDVAVLGALSAALFLGGVRSDTGFQS